MARRPRHYELRSVKGFYMAGQWAEAWGGITTAAQSGRKVIQLILSKEGRRLVMSVTREPGQAAMFHVKHCRAG